MKCCFAIFTLAISIASVTAQAAFINNASGLINPSTIITFDEIALSDGQVIDNEFSPLGVTFSPNLLFASNNGGCGAPQICAGMSGQMLVLGAEGLVPDFTMIFSMPVSAAMFAAIDSDGQYVIQALLGPTLVEQAQLAISDFPGQGFIGFQGIEFDRVRVEALTSTNFGMDNLQLQQVQQIPEPATLALLSVMLTGFALSRRKRR